MTDDRPRLALTMGDPAGIGPEICLAVCAMPVVRKVADIAVVGTRTILERTARDLKLPDPCTESGGLRLVEVGPARRPIPAGHVSEDAGRLSAAYLDRAITMALAGEVDAIVTAPISKDAWHRAGVGYPGHTEYLADRVSRAKGRSIDYGMMLVQNSWRVLHLSTHLALRQAIELVKRDRIERMLGLFDQSLHELEIASPSIAVAALNPHAGEGGMFGDEEITEIAPAIESARAKGIRVTGPISPDTVFARARTGEFDGVLAMYHDQGHVAVKTLGFEPGPSGRWSAVHGVNVTIGLPVIRTSVDHGVAFDIAGQGIARPDSLVDAVLLAAQMARARARRSQSAAAKA